MHKWLQTLLPQHALSRVFGYCAHMRHPVSLKNWVIRQYIKGYKVDMREALLTEPEAYPTFNHFFSRRLKPEARPLPADQGRLVAPADGKIDQLGEIDLGMLLQAKGVGYPLLQLLGGDQAWADQFLGGKFMTIYLSPRDYHRVHMPLTGQLQQMRYIPGRLFSVNPKTAAAIPGLFVRNERAIFYFQTAVGPFAIVMVGAMLVASIHTAWAGHLMAKTPLNQSYTEEMITLNRGEEVGHFELGSTVIILTPPHSVSWDEKLRPGAAIRMGEGIGG